MNGHEHPALAPYRDLLTQLAQDQSLAALNQLAAQLNIRHRHSGLSLRFSSAISPACASDYERGIADTGIIPTRENNTHDFFNALVWLRFPGLKSAINHRHCQMLKQSQTEHKQRGAVRDQLTLLDENGVLVASRNPHLLMLLHQRQWLELFWDARQDVTQDMSWMVIGHGLLEKCLNPFAGMTAKCLFLPSGETTPETMDAAAATLTLNTQEFELPPLPIQGIPGWEKNQQRSTYLNTDVFRPLRTP